MATRTELIIKTKQVLAMILYMVLGTFIMEGKIEIKQIDKDVIEVLGVKYYTEDYLKEMMRREHSRGIREGQQVHIAKIEKCTNCA